MSLHYVPMPSDESTFYILSHYQLVGLTQQNAKIFTPHLFRNVHMTLFCRLIPEIIRNDEK